MILLLACTAPDPAAPVVEASITATVSDRITTVIEVTWEPADAPGVYVEHDGERIAGEGGRAVLYGIPADTDVAFHLTAGDWTSAEHVATTGSLPSGLPEVTLLQPGDPGSRYIATSWLVTPDEGSGVFVLDADANIVWYDVVEGLGVAPVVKKVDGGFLYLVTSQAYLGDSHAVYVSADGETREEYPLPLAHHDILPVPGARFATLLGEVREVDGQPVVGDDIVEVYEDGTQRVVWSSFDTFDPVPNEGWGVFAYPEGADWIHANGLDYDPTEDAYYLSLFRLRCVVKIDRATGEAIWIFGGDSGQFTFEEDPGFGPQHAPQWVDGELMMFDNGYTTGESRLVRYDLDPETGIATRTWEWHHPDALYTVVLGDIDIRPGGGHLSAWGTFGEIVATDAEDAMVWRADVETTFVVAQVEGFDTF